MAGGDAAPWRELLALREPLREPLVRAARRQQVPLGFGGWCDAEARASSAARGGASRQADSTAADAWALEAAQHTELIAAGMLASSTDNEQQTIRA